MKKKIIVCLSVIMLTLGIVGIEKIKLNLNSGQLVINEVVTANGTLADEEGLYPDWIELFNAGDSSINLSGYYLSDNREENLLWRFPEVELSPGEYLVIFASGKNRTTEEGEIHTNFKLEAMGETLYLSTADGKLVENVEIPELSFDTSYGRIEEGMQKLQRSSYTTYAEGSPNEKNNQPQAVKTRATKAVEYSVAAGVYAEAIFLELQTEEQDAVIYYTLDGSVPANSSQKYEGDFLVIEERTQEENQYTSVWSSPYDWEGSGNYSYNPNPQYKATVVKTRLYFPEEDVWSEEVWTNTYLVGADYSLPVISLSVEEADLFDEHTGICVPGDAYTEYMETAEEINPEPRKRTANYSSDRKVSGYLEYFTAAGSKVMENQITMRVCGNISRGSGMKSFAVYAWGDDTTGIFSYPIFGDQCQDEEGNQIKSFTSLRLRNFGNDWRRSKFRDILGQSIVKELNLGYQSYQPAIVLINGEYYGLCEIRENRDGKYYEDHFGVPEELLQEVKVAELYDQKETAEENDFLELLSYMEENDLSNEESAKIVEEQFDVEQFLDYVLVQLYMQNIDWYNNNCDFYRIAPTQSSTSERDSRWKVLLYDMDYSINYEMVDNYDSFFSSDYHNARITRALLKNPQWKTYFTERFEELLQTCLEPTRALELQKVYEQQIEAEISEDLARWDVYLDGQLIKNTSQDYWYEKMEDLQRFFVERPEYAETYFYAAMEKYF